MKVFGHETWLAGLSTPSVNSAVEVTVFIVEPGATAAVSAKSLKPALLAMARILPVDGWTTTNRAVVMPVDGRPGSLLRCRVDRCGESRDVPRRDHDRLGAGEGLARPALNLDVQARGSVPGGRACLQPRGDVVQPRVTVTGEIVAAGVGDRGDPRGDRDGIKVRGRGEVRSQVGGCPGDVPVLGLLRLIGDQRCVVAPGSVDRRSAVRRGHASAGRVDDLLPKGRQARRDRCCRPGHTGELPEVQVRPERRKGGPGGSRMIGVVRRLLNVTRVPGAQEGAGRLLRVLASR